LNFTEFHKFSFFFCSSEHFLTVICGGKTCPASRAKARWSTVFQPVKVLIESGDTAACAGKPPTREGGCGYRTANERRGGGEGGVSRKSVCRRGATGAMSQIVVGVNEGSVCPPPRMNSDIFSVLTNEVFFCCWSSRWRAAIILRHIGHK